MTSDKKGAYYHGRDVHVDDILFRPDRELLSAVRRFEVDQSPFGQVFHTDEADIDARLTALFATHDIASHKDVYNAFDKTLTRGRVTFLLRRLVGEGRLIALGSGAQTLYRPRPFREIKGIESSVPVITPAQFLGSLLFDTPHRW